MSRPSFRARPIDIAQALAIVRDESVLNDESHALLLTTTVSAGVPPPGQAHYVFERPHAARNRKTRHVEGTGVCA